MSQDETKIFAEGTVDSGGNPHLWEINWVRDLFYLGVLLCGLFFVVWLRAIFQPVLMGLLFAYLINPLIIWCEQKRKWSRFFAACILLASAAVVVVGLTLAILPVAIRQTTELLSKLPDYLDALAARAGVSDEAVRQEIRSKGEAFMEDPVTNLSYLWDGVVTSFGLLSGVLGTATSLAIGLSLFPIYLFFFTWKWPSVVAWPTPFVPVSRREGLRKLLAKMDKAVGGYFRTRLFIAFVMGIMYSVGWGIAGVPYWLLVGMLGGLLGIIPYAATLAWLAAMLLRFLELEHGFASFGDALAVLLWPTLVFAIVQSADDWVLTPWLQGRELDMNFVTIMLAVLIGGAVAGLLGMLLAVPTAACIRIYWMDVVRPRLVSHAELH